MVKIKVKLGQAEAEVEADPEHLREAIDLIPEVAGKLPQMGRASPAADPADTARPADFPPREHAEAPVVTLEKGDSLADVIAKFFAGPWGRERRKLSDVREALQSYGLNYPKQSVAVALLRLAKATKLRRFKAEDGEYVYTSATTVPARTPQQDDDALQAADAVQLA
ncbi:MAG: hypothetical protein JRM85_01640 [Nitrososphaerota archaeon]|nr:hypothetical protein [Nitrososphaerota archaeon]MDG6946723.1 hypothetical protein [Nitrososphaerota archaeon]